MGELFGKLVTGMATLLEWLYKVTVAIGVPNYGLAIIMLTILVRLVLFPLNYRQMRSVVALQQLHPKIKELQERYKQDPQKLQQKLMELYREHNVNPMAGCLPLLIQLPILIALYRALLSFPYTVAEHARFLWVPSLSHTDPYFILPVLAGVTTYWQMKITPQAAGQEQQQRMMGILMSGMILWISATLPAGLALYWVVYNLISVAQQYFFNKHLLAGGKGASELAGSDKKR
ncbi:membrane protein insertase, YidC/Oxa1 family [Ammonifex degensii KC4]|uniref:Membrane protein insertase, YidC/Oxa1 family n=1 Tax=Ammonifex degensii (strain DSM 10501 / KC4) TaxID=429009 RepID=C9RAI0_AMMDK|nr:YidC/Oxa1 family membrane protein insertase [Ammonifex degensii]ACX53226.1 membrane protein insertase, YidC/Oxa1 family [Ammonifex degensii KC4]